MESGPVKKIEKTDPNTIDGIAALALQEGLGFPKGSCFQEALIFQNPNRYDTPLNSEEEKLDEENDNKISTSERGFR